MPCYRKGGCGPYENTPCCECPAAHAAYLDQQDDDNIKPRKASKRVKFELETRTSGEYALRILEPLSPNELTIKNIRNWLSAHEIRKNRFALSLPKAMKDPAGKYKTYAAARTALMDEESPIRDAAQIAAERVLDEIAVRQGLIDQTPVIRLPHADNPAFRLTAIPEVDMVMSPDEKIIQRYNLVRAFDAACQVAWYIAMYGITTIKAIPSKPERSGLSDRDRLLKFQNQMANAMLAISKEYDAGGDTNEDMIAYLVKANIPVYDAVRLLYPVDIVTERDLIPEYQDIE